MHQFAHMTGGIRQSKLREIIWGGVLVFLIIFLILGATAHAGVPRILAFQGRLTNSSGDLLGSSGTNYFFKFAIYNSASGGTKLWPAADPPEITAKVTQGVFNVLLGDTAAGFPALDIDFDSQNYFLEVSVSNASGGTYETLNPRQRIVASGFAINAETVHGGRFINATGVGQFGSLSTTSYSRFGTTATSHGLSAAQDLLVSGTLELESQTFFDTNASVAGNFELTGASSKFGINAGNLIDTAFEVGGTASVSSLRVSSGIIGNSASISTNFEATGFASASAFFGGAFSSISNCNLESQTLLWNSATGKFSCGNDDIGSGGTLTGIRESGGTFSNKSSLSFEAGHFNITFPNATEALVKLDWVTGPASRAANELITGFWRFTAASTQITGLEITNNASIGGNAILTGLFSGNGTGSNSFAGSLDISKGLRALDITANGRLNVLGNTILAGLSAGASNLGATTLASLIVSGHSTIPIASGSTFELSTLKVNTISRDTGVITIANNTSASLNFEVLGYASASQLYGAGLGACTGGNKLLWTGGIFSCAQDSTGISGIKTEEAGSPIVAAATILNFTGTDFSVAASSSEAIVSLDYANSGITRTGQNELITGFWHFSAASTQLTSLELTNSASIGGNIVVKGAASIVGAITQSGAAASNSFAGSLNTTLGLHALTDVSAGGRFVGSGVGSNSFAGSLDVAKGIRGLDVTALGRILGLGVGSNSFAGSLDVAKGIRGLDITANGRLTILGNTSLTGLTADTSNLGSTTVSSLNNTGHSALTTASGSAFEVSTLKTDTISRDSGIITFANAGLFSTHVSVSGTFEGAGTIKTTTIGSDTTLTLAPTDARTFVTGNASVSLGFESLSIKTNALSDSTGTLTIGAFTLGGLVTGNGQDIIGINNASASGVIEVPTVKVNILSRDGNGSILISNNTSVSLNFEIIGYASVSKLFGAGLTNCVDPLLAKLLWTTSGLFSCGEDQASGGVSIGRLELRELAVFSSVGVSTISFEPGHFNLSASSSNDTIVKLDWINGPASRSVNQTITGSWLFNNASNQFTNSLEIGVASASQYLGGGLTSCSNENQTLNWNSTTGRFTCLADDQGSAGGSSFPGIEIIESGGTFGTHYGSISFAANSFNVSFPTASSSLIAIDYANGPASRSIAQSITGGWTFTNASNQFSNTLEIGTASIGGNIVVKGTAAITGAITQSLAAASNSFQGSLNTLLGLHATTDISAGGRFIGTGVGSNSFAGSLDVAKGIRGIDLTSTGRFLGSGAGSNSFAGSLDVLKGIRGLDLTANGRLNVTGSSILTALTAGTTSLGATNVTTLAASGRADLSTHVSVSGTFESGPIKTDTLSASGATLTINAFTLGGQLSAGDQNITNAATIEANTLQDNDDGTLSINDDLSIIGGASSSVAFEAATGKFGTLSVDAGIILISNNATASLNFEVLGYSSASQIFGAGLSACTGANKLLWSTGIFSCSPDLQGSSGSQIEIRESSDPTGTNVSSISFEAGNFDVSFSSGEAIIQLDWSSGPASRSANQLITGFWNFNAASTQLTGFELINNASIGGNIVVKGTAAITGAITQSLAAASNSFAGSLNTILGLHSGTDVSAVGRFIGTGATSNSFAGSINTLLGLHATTDISAGGRFIGTGVGSNSFAGSLDVAKSLRVTGTITELNTGSNSFAGSLDVAKGIRGLDVTANGKLSVTGTSTLSTLTAGTTILGATGVTTLSASGLATFSGGVSVSTNFEVTGNNRVGINAGGATETSLEVGGTASISGVTTLGSTLTVVSGITQSAAAVSNSFTGSLNTILGLHSGTDISAVGRFIGTGAVSNSFAGSLNTATLGIHAGSDVSAGGRFLGIGLGSNSFAGSLDVIKGIRGIDLTSTGRFIGTGVGSNSFAGSLNISKGLSANSIQGAGLSTCTSIQKLQFGSGQFTCVSEQASITGIKTEEGGTQIQSAASILNFGSTDFALTSSGSTETVIAIDYANSGITRVGQNETITGKWFFNNDASVAGNFELTGATSKLGINAGGLINNALEVGGTASISGAATLGSTLSTVGAITQSGAATSNSFAGSLNTTLGLHSLTDVSAGGRFIGIGGGSNSFAGSADISKSLRVTGIVIGLSVGSNSFAGSLDVSKGIRGLDVTANGRLNVIGTSTLGALNAGATSLTTLSATGLATFSGGVSVSTNFEVTGNNRVGINAGGATNTTFEVGGTASISGAATLGSTLTVVSGITQSAAATSNSFAGSLNTILGLHSATDVSAGGRFIGTAAASNSFQGSLNTLLGLHATTDISAGGRFIGTGVGSNSFAGSLDVAKGIRGIDLTSTGRFLGSGAGSNSFAGSLDVTKGIRALDITATGRLNVTGATTLAGLTAGTTNLGATGVTTLSASGLALFNGRASVSANFEVMGTASISAFSLTDSATGIGMIDCNEDNQALGWDITTGRFFCGDDDTTGGSTRPASDSLDWDEMTDTMSLDTNTTLASNGLTFSWGKTDFLNIGNAKIGRGGTLQDYLLVRNEASGLVIRASSALAGSHLLTITGNDQVTGDAGDVGSVKIKGGDGTADGGNLDIYGGSAGTGGDAGNITIRGGDAIAATGNGGILLLQGGPATGCSGASCGMGAVTIEGGVESSNTFYADVTLQPNGGRVGIVSTDAAHKFNVEGNTRTSGHLLTGDELIVTNAAQFAGTSTVAYSRFGTAATNRALSTSNDLLISGDLEVDTKAWFDGTVSISSIFEVSSIASISAFRLTDSATEIAMVDCDLDTQALGWDITTGRFFCGDDDTGGGASAPFKGISLREGTGTFTHVGSLSFEANMFDVGSVVASNSLIKLDWVNGPASRAADQTITGNWEFRSGASFSGNNFFNKTVSVSGTFESSGTVKAITLLASTSIQLYNDAAADARLEIRSSGLNDKRFILTSETANDRFVIENHGLTNLFTLASSGNAAIGVVSEGSLAEFSLTVLASADVAFQNVNSISTTGATVAVLNFGDGFGAKQAYIKAFRDAGTSGGDNPMALSFWTTPDGATQTSAAERLRIANSGVVTFFNGASSSTNFEVSGTASISAFKLTDAATGIAFADCDADNQAVGWDITTGRFVCGDDDGGGGGGDAGFAIEAVNTFVANGTWVWNATGVGAGNAYVQVWGAGGGGGGAGILRGGSGAGGGGYAAGVRPVGANVNIFFNTTAGGGGAANTNGGTGGNASFNNSGGSPVGATGGVAGHNSTANIIGGGGGTGSGGSIQLTGTQGGNVTAAGTKITGGGGGGAPLGGAGGAPGSLNNSGISATGGNGTLPGGGGGGGSANNGPGGNGGNGMVIVWALSGTNGSDLAEFFVVEDGVEPGDVVAIGSGDASYDTDKGLQKTAVLKKATPEDRVVGVVSTNPYQVMNRELGAQRPSDTQPIALSGTAHVKVSLTNGSIKKGDLLSASNVPGVAVRTDKAGLVIGSALEDFDGTASSSQILMFISTTYSTGARTNALLENYGIKQEDIPVGVDIGRLLLAQMISHKNEITSSTSLSEIFSDRIMAALEIISPRVLTDTLVVNSIEPVDRDIGIKIVQGGIFELTRAGPDQLSSTFGIGPPEAGVPILTIDDLGNAFFAGAIKVESLTVGSTEKPSGITFYDTATGQPYCVTVTNGILTHIPGVCGSVPNIFQSSQTSPTPTVSPLVTPELIPIISVEPSVAPSTSPEPTTSPFLSPTPEPTATPSPEPTSSPTPLPSGEPTPTPVLTSPPEVTESPPVESASPPTNPPPEPTAEVIVSI